MRTINFISLTLILLSLLAAACAGNKDKDPLLIFNDSIRAYIKKNAKDPGSYEPVSTKVLDTFYYSQNLDRRIKFLEDNITEYKAMIEEFGDNVGNYKTNIENNSREMDFYSQQLDSLSRSANPKAVAAYVVAHNCKLNHGLGIAVFRTLAFDFRPNYSIFYSYDFQLGKPTDYPGGFPREFRK